MLQPGGPVHVKDTEFRGCEAWQLGGALCTETDEQDQNVNSTLLQRSTPLYIAAKFIGNKGSPKNLFVGPIFDLRDSHGYMFTDPSQGRVWVRKKCEVGEYIPSQYCEPCQAYTYSFKAEPLTECPAAPNNTYAPGGAVLVPHSDFWHGDSKTLQACETCGSLDLSIIKRCGLVEERAQQFWTVWHWGAAVIFSSAGL